MQKFITRIIKALGFLAVVLTATGIFVLPVIAHTPLDVREGRLRGNAIHPAVEQSESINASDEEVVVSDVMIPSFPFNGVLTFLPDSIIRTTSVQFDVRVFEGDAWSPWHTLHALKDRPANAPVVSEKIATEPLFFLDAKRLQYRIVGNIASVPIADRTSAEFVYINSRTPQRPLSWIVNMFGLQRASAGPLVSVMPRSTWGADESYRLTSDGQERWKPTYAPVEKVIIHHTAGSNGGTDPAAVVRGVYYFHAMILGWGDIGYNYLIDPAGTIYEGRYGGDGVVGGHAYNDQEQTDYNQGTIGVSFLGNYESEFLSEAARLSATSLIAEKAQLFSINPTGTSTFRTRTDLPTIVGHRDVDATACPGANVRSQLQTIRDESAQKLAALPPLPPATFAAAATGPTSVSVTANANTPSIATISYTNASSVAWQTYFPARRVTLRPISTPSALYATGWAAADAISTGTEANVPVGATATFAIPLTPPDTVLAIQGDVALFDPNGIELSGTRTHLVVNIQNQTYAARFEKVTQPVATLVKQKRTVAVTLHNIGTQTWKRGDIILRVADANNQPSAYRTSAWKSTFGDFSVDHECAPGETVTVRVPVRSPESPGLYLNVYSLVRSDGTAFASEERRIVARADSPWRAELVERRFPVAVRSGWKPTMIVKYKNTGTTTWTRQVVLGVYDSGLLPSRFRHPSWKSSSGKITMQQNLVRPGEVATFLVPLKSPKNSGVYRQVLQLERAYTTTVIQNGTAEFLTRVDG